MSTHLLLVLLVSVTPWWALCDKQRTNQMLFSKFYISMSFINLMVRSLTFLSFFFFSSLPPSLSHELGGPLSCNNQDVCLSHNRLHHLDWFTFLEEWVLPSSSSFSYPSSSSSFYPYLCRCHCQMNLNWSPGEHMKHCSTSLLKIKRLDALIWLEWITFFFCFFFFFFFFFFFLSSSLLEESEAWRPKKN